MTGNEGLVEYEEVEVELRRKEEEEVTLLLLLKATSGGPGIYGPLIPHNNKEFGF